MSMQGLFRELLDRNMLRRFNLTDRIANPDRVLELYPGQESHLRIQGLEIYEAMEKSDAHIASCLQTRRQALLSIPYQIQSPDDSLKQQEITRFVQENLLIDLPMEQIMNQLLYAFNYGFMVMEKIYSPSQKWVCLDKLLGKSPAWFGFDHEENLLFVDENLQSHPLPREKFVIHSPAATHNNPYGKSILGERVYWMYYFKKSILKLWLRFLEKYGIPTVIGKYPVGAKQAEQDELFDLMQSVISDYTVIMSSSMEMDIKEMSSGKEDLFQKFMDWADRNISKAILGQTLTVDTQNTGSLAQSKVHKQILDAIVQSDAKALAMTINRDIIQPLVILNYGFQSAYPQFQFDLGSMDDLETRSKIDERIIQMGLPIGQSYLYKKYNLPHPEKNESLVEPLSKLRIIRTTLPEKEDIHDQ